MKEQITFDIFDKVDIRVGTVISVKKNEKARKPSLVVEVDFGKDIGIKKSSGKKHISLKVGYLLQGYSSEHNNWSWWWGPIDIFPGQNITNDTIRRDGYFNRMTISLSVLF